MRFSVLSAVLAFVLSANAAAVSKRAISAPVQTCVNDLSATSSLLTTLNNAVANYNTTQGFAGGLVIQSKEVAVGKKLNTTQNDCCAITTTVTEEEANTVIAEFDTFTTKFESTLQAFIDVRSVFESPATLLLPYFKIDINNLSTSTVALSTCLVANTPADLASTTQGYVDRLNTSFAAAIAAYASYANIP